MRHYYIRHAEHTKDTLTETGIAEARTVHTRLLELEPNLEQYLQHIVTLPHQEKIQAWSADTFRSLATTALALVPSAKDEDLVHTVQSLIDTDTLHIDPRLRYAKFSENDTEIREAYQTAYEKGRTMDFYIRDSNTFLRRNPMLSTHSTLAAEVARRTLFTPEGDAPHLHCAREFFWPNFRAAVLESQNKTKERDQYIEWYCSEKELNPQARTDVARIVRDSDTMILEDDYGALACTERDLRAVIQKGAFHA